MIDRALENTRKNMKQVTDQMEALYKSKENRVDLICKNNVALNHIWFIFLLFAGIFVLPNAFILLFA